MDGRNVSRSRNDGSPDYVSLETTEACLENTEANQGKVEIKVEVCL
jgi:hypothetical protein